MRRWIWFLNYYFWTYFILVSFYSPTKQRPNLNATQAANSVLIDNWCLWRVSEWGEGCFISLLAEQKVICIVLLASVFESGTLIEPVALRCVAFHLKAVSFLSLSLSLFCVAPTNIPKPPPSRKHRTNPVRVAGIRWRWRRQRRLLHRGSLRSKGSRRSAAYLSSRFRILLPPIRLRFGNTFSATRISLTSTITSPSSSPAPRYSFANSHFLLLLLLLSRIVTIALRFFGLI